MTDFKRINIDEFQLCGGVMLAGKQNQLIITCNFCQQMYKQLQVFMRHLQLQHNDKLQFVKQVKEVEVYAVEELMNQTGVTSLPGMESKECSFTAESNGSWLSDDDMKWLDEGVEPNKMKLNGKHKNKEECGNGEGLNVLNMSILKALADSDVSLSFMENSKSPKHEIENDRDNSMKRDFCYTNGSIPNNNYFCHRDIFSSKDVLGTSKDFEEDANMTERLLNNTRLNKTIGDSKPIIAPANFITSLLHGVKDVDGSEGLWENVEDHLKPNIIKRENATVLNKVTDSDYSVWKKEFTNSFANNNNNNNALLNTKYDHKFKRNESQSLLESTEKVSELKKSNVSRETPLNEDLAKALAEALEDDIDLLNIDLENENGDSLNADILDLFEVDENEIDFKEQQVQTKTERNKLTEQKSINTNENNLKLKFPKTNLKARTRIHQTQNKNSIKPNKPFVLKQSNHIAKVSQEPFKGICELGIPSKSAIEIKSLENNNERDKVQKSTSKENQETSVPTANIIKFNKKEKFENFINMDEGSSVVKREEDKTKNNLIQDSTIRTQQSLNIQTLLPAPSKTNTSVKIIKIETLLPAVNFFINMDRREQRDQIFVKQIQEMPTPLIKNTTPKEQEKTSPKLQQNPTVHIQKSLYAKPAVATASTTNTSVKSIKIEKFLPAANFINMDRGVKGEQIFVKQTQEMPTPLIKYTTPKEQEKTSPKLQQNPTVPIQKSLYAKPAVAPASTTNTSVKSIKIEKFLPAANFINMDRGVKGKQIFGKQTQEMPTPLIKYTTPREEEKTSPKLQQNHTVHIPESFNTQPVVSSTSIKTEKLLNASNFINMDRGVKREEIFVKHSQEIPTTLIKNSTPNEEEKTAEKLQQNSTVHIQESFNTRPVVPAPSKTNTSVKIIKIETLLPAVNCINMDRREKRDEIFVKQIQEMPTPLIKNTTTKEEEKTSPKLQQNLTVHIQKSLNAQPAVATATTTNTSVKSIKTEKFLPAANFINMDRGVKGEQIFGKQTPEMPTTLIKNSTPKADEKTASKLQQNPIVHIQESFNTQPVVSLTSIETEKLLNASNFINMDRGVNGEQIFGKQTPEMPTTLIKNSTPKEDEKTASKLQQNPIVHIQESFNTQPVVSLTSIETEKLLNASNFINMDRGVKGEQIFGKQTPEMPTTLIKNSTPKEEEKTASKLQQNPIVHIQESFNTQPVVSLTSIETEKLLNASNFINMDRGVKGEQIFGKQTPEMPTTLIKNSTPKEEEKTASKLQQNPTVHMQESFNTQPVVSLTSIETEKLLNASNFINMGRGVNGEQIFGKQTPEMPTTLIKNSTPKEDEKTASKLQQNPIVHIQESFNTQPVVSLTSIETEKLLNASNFINMDRGVKGEQIFGKQTPEMPTTLIKNSTPKEEEKTASKLQQNPTVHMQESFNTQPVVSLTSIKTEKLLNAANFINMDRGVKREEIFVKYSQEMPTTSIKNSTLKEERKPSPKLQQNPAIQTQEILNAQPAVPIARQTKSTGGRKRKERFKTPDKNENLNSQHSSPAVRRETRSKKQSPGNQEKKESLKPYSTQPPVRHGASNLKCKESREQFPRSQEKSNKQHDNDKTPPQNYNITPTPPHKLRNVVIKLRRLTHNELLHVLNNQGKICLENKSSNVSENLKLPKNNSLSIATKERLTLDDTQSQMVETPTKTSYCKQNFTESSLRRIHHAEIKYKNATKAKLRPTKEHNEILKNLPTNVNSTQDTKASSNKTPRNSNLNHKSYAAVRCSRKNEVLQRMRNIKKQIFKSIEDSEYVNKLKRIEKQKKLIKDSKIVPNSPHGIVTPLITKNFKKPFEMKSSSLTALSPPVMVDQQHILLNGNKKNLSNIDKATVKETPLKRRASSPLLTSAKLAKASCDGQKEEVVEKITNLEATQFKLSDSVVNFLKDDLKTSPVNLESLLAENMSTEETSAEANLNDTKTEEMTLHNESALLLLDLYEQVENEQIADEKLQRAFSTPKNDNVTNHNRLNDFDDSKDINLLSKFGLKIIKLPDIEDNVSLEECDEMHEKAINFANLYKNWPAIWTTKNTASPTLREKFTKSCKQLLIEINSSFNLCLTMIELKRLVNLISFWYKKNCSSKLIEKRRLSDSTNSYLLMFNFIPKTINHSYLCEYCEEYFNTHHKYYTHRIIHTGAPYPYECKNCAMGYKREHQFRNHESSCLVMPNYKVKPSPKNYMNLTKQYICQVCAEIFATTQLLYEHSKEHLKTIYNCAKCELVFDSAMDVENHMNSCKAVTICMPKPTYCNTLEPKLVNIK